MTGDDGKPYCVTSECGDTEYTCLGMGVTATNQTSIENGYKWNCLGSECLKCNSGYTEIDWECKLIEDWLCGVLDELLMVEMKQYSLDGIGSVKEEDQVQREQYVMNVKMMLIGMV